MTTIIKLYKMFKRLGMKRADALKLALREYEKVKGLLDIPYIGADLAISQTQLRINMALHRLKHEA